MYIPMNMPGNRRFLVIVMTHISGIQRWLKIDD